jgi:hypothetical protein
MIFKYHIEYGRISLVLKYTIKYDLNLKVIIIQNPTNIFQKEIKILIIENK